MIRKRYLLAAIGIIFLISIILLGSHNTSNNLYVKSVSFKDNLVDIHGGTAESGKGFTGLFTYKIRNKSLYLRPVYFIVTPLNPNGEFKIGVNNGADKIEKVYLEGSGWNDSKQVWP